MKRLLPFVLLVAAGCPTSAETAGAGDDATDPDPGNAGAVECQVDEECTAAGESCCSCPTFAVPTASGWQDSCEDVTCEPPTGCAAEAVCEAGACVLACVELACEPDASCDGGFARDAAGCLSCDCAPAADPAADQCAVDADCVQVAADCCGCAEGGTDTAVPASEATGFTDSLGCDGSTSCPGVDVCDPSAEPRCLAGTCQLVAAPGGGGDLPPDGGLGGEEPQLCGTPELAPCPAGQRCVVNDPDVPDASEMGVGVCRPQGG